MPDPMLVFLAAALCVALGFAVTIPGPTFNAASASTPTLSKGTLPFGMPDWHDVKRIIFNYVWIFLSAGASAAFLAFSDADYGSYWNVIKGAVVVAIGATAKQWATNTQTNTVTVDVMTKPVPPTK